MADLKNSIKNLLVFKEPEKNEKFTLKENKNETLDPSGPSSEVPIQKPKESKSYVRKILEQPDDNKEHEKEEDKKKQKSEISSKLSDNLEFIKKAFTLPKNGDVILREFDLIFNKKFVSAFIVFYDGMVDRKVINEDILKPLMLLSNLDIKGEDKDIADYVRKHLLPQNDMKEMKKFEKIIGEINFGSCGIFIDGMDSAFVADVKGWEHRKVERPNTELILRGPQEGFSETLRTNTALIRKMLKDENLIVENVEIGKRSKTPCSILYIKDIANESLVAEVRRRLKSIKIDYIFDTGELEQFIEDSSTVPVPLTLSTERPDRVASMLADGRVAIILSGSPFALVVPITNNDLIHSTEDTYVRFPYANLLRLVRVIGVFTSLLLPAFYVAITNFHHEMIPTDLLFAIAASREKMPFPSLVEILIMEIAFELIREAGIRIPGPIGPTLGIIGALILGQASVAANIVSPILIIIVAVTGIGSFAIPNFSLAFAFRILRFAFISLAAMVGLLGISLGLFIMGLWLVNTKSFGVPFMAPFGPTTFGGLADQFIRSPMWKQERRLDYFNTKDEEKQSKISRQWIKKEKGEGKKNGK